MSADQEIVPTTETPAAPAAAAATTDKVDTPPADGAQTPAQTRDENGRFRNPVQPRIDELTRKTREAEREAAYWRGRAEKAEKPAEPKAEKPKAESFEKYDDYVEALADWKADEKIRANNEATRAETAKERAERERQTSWDQRRSEASARIPGFDQVMSASDVPVAEHVWDLVQEAERGPEVLHAMAKDPALADRLNGMSPRKAAIEIGRIEAGLPAISATPDPEESARTDEPAARVETPPARKQSSAPPPIKPTPKGSSTTTDLSKLSMDDYVEKRRTQGASWARR